jgi:hypothetical protein
MKIKSKLQFPIAVAIMSFAIISMIFQGCEKEEFFFEETENHFEDTKLKSESILQADEFRFLNKTYKVPEGESIWEAQLNKIIENNYLLEPSELELAGYQHIRKIDNLDELKIIKAEIINNNSLYPIYNENSEKFTIVKKDMPELKLFLDMLIPDSEYAKSLVPVESGKSLLSNARYFFVKNDLGVVHVEWKHKGKIHYTTCLVSEKKGIVYDSFLYFIHFRIGQGESIGTIPTTISRLKSTNIEEEGEPIHYYFTKWDAGHNLYGQILWKYDINCMVTGTLVGSQKSITDKSMDAYHDAMWPFWYCDAKVNSKSFVTGVNGHLDFAWGWTYKYATSVSLTWNGIGFTMTGGGTGSTGEEYVIPSELN